MNPEKNYNEIYDLLIMLLEGDLTDSQAEQLVSWSKSDPDAAKIYADFMNYYSLISSEMSSGANGSTGSFDTRFDRALTDASIERPETGIADSNISSRGVELPKIKLDADIDQQNEFELTQAMFELLSMERTAPPVEIKKPAETGPERELVQKVESNFKLFPGRPSKFGIRTLLAMAACILVVLSYLQFFVPDVIDPPIVASLADSIDVVWDNELQTPDKFGDMIQSRYRLTKGYASILFNDGAKVTVEAPAELSLDSSSAMELFSGRIYSIVPNRAKGFAVTAASSKIVDLGTEFGVEVDGGGNTQLHVIKGRTLLFAGLLAGEKDEVEVGAGAAKKVYSDGFVKDVDIAENKFVRHIESYTGSILKRDSHLVIYEPFDYPAGELDGQSGVREIGLDGAWSAERTSVVAGSLTYNKLAVRGGSIGIETGVGSGGSRAVSKSALKENGLFEDGATLWFSIVIGLGVNSNKRNSDLQFALANSGFVLNKKGYFLSDKNSKPVSGIGIVLKLGEVTAVKFGDSKSYESAHMDIHEFSGNAYTSGQHGLIIGKIVWGADSDTMELYQPDKNFNLGPPVSVLKTSVDQSTFDTITFRRSDDVVIDEIRFGNSYSSVLGSW